jgi:hypothetical protein
VPGRPPEGTPDDDVAGGADGPARDRDDDVLSFAY